MSVVLASRAPVGRDDFDAWASPDGTPGPDGGTALDLGPELESAFDRVIPAYLALCARLGRTPSAVLSHTASAAVNCSDLGILMAWCELLNGWIAGSRRILLLCRDPWLFRHFAAQAGVTAATPPPPLWRRSMALAVRGLSARAVYAARALRRALTPAPKLAPGGTWLLSYAHPASTATTDAYFGTLLADLPGLRRVVHVDGAGTEPNLAHWGSIAAALSLPFARWRPEASDMDGPWGWLVRRAAALEGGTAQGAAIAWQIACQRAWLRAARPHAVAWPWENHGWERDLCRAARAMGARSIGYQHATVGRTELNIHGGSNPDGPASLPDAVLCGGPLFRDELAARGVPGRRCAVGGALRYAGAAPVRFDAAAPIFIALPADRPIARQLVAAAQAAARVLGRRMLVRPHPIYDVEVPEDALLRRADAGLTAQPAVSAVVYAATTVGLEAVLAGLPTIRFVPTGCVALDILPKPIVVPSANAGLLAEALARAVPPSPLRREDVFAPVDLGVWRAALDPV